MSKLLIIPTVASISGLKNTLNQSSASGQVLCDKKDLFNLFIGPVSALLGTAIGLFGSLLVEKIKRKFSLEDRDEERRFMVYGEINSFAFSTKQLYSSRFEALIHSDYHEQKWKLGGHKDSSIDLSESKRWMLISEEYVNRIISNHQKLHKCLAKITLLYKNDSKIISAVRGVMSLKNPEILEFPEKIDSSTIEKWKIDAKSKLAIEIKQNISTPLLNLIAILDKKLKKD